MVNDHVLKYLLELTTAATVVLHRLVFLLFRLFMYWYDKMASPYCCSYTISTNH